MNRKESEYTKGEWTIEPTGVDGGDDKLIIGHPNPKDFNNIRTIGRLFTYGTKEENEANARLIAAAPKMLAACKEVRATFVGYGEGSIGGQALKKVRAAIAKAEK